MLLHAAETVNITECYPFYDHKKSNIDESVKDAFKSPFKQYDDYALCNN